MKKKVLATRMAATSLPEGYGSNGTSLGNSTKQPDGGVKRRLMKAMPTSL